MASIKVSFTAKSRWTTFSIPEPDIQTALSSFLLSTAKDSNLDNLYYANHPFDWPAEDTAPGMGNPCPDGWRMPTVAEWKTFKDSFSQGTTMTHTDGYMYNEFYKSYSDIPYILIYHRQVKLIISIWNILKHLIQDSIPRLGIEFMVITGVPISMHLVAVIPRHLGLYVQMVVDTMKPKCNYSDNIPVLLQLSVA